MYDLNNAIGSMKKIILARKELGLPIQWVERRLEAAYRLKRFQELKSIYTSETGLYRWEDEELYSTWLKHRKTKG